MPAFYAHHLFGRSVLEELPAPLKKSFLPYLTEFSLGCQGPDILFYHKPFSANEIKKKGMEMHLSSAYGFFGRSAKKIAGQSAENVIATPLAAYIAGFICHFSLDNACHGHIYKLEATGVSHGRIESEFDKHLKRAQGEKVHKNAAKYLNDKKNTSLAVHTALDVPQKNIKHAMKTMKRVNGLFSSNSKLFHKFAKFFLRKVKAEKFFEMFLHFDDEPSCTALNATLEEKLLEAVPQTANRITRYFENLETAAQTGETDKEFDRDYTGDKIQ